MYSWKTFVASARLYGGDEFACGLGLGAAGHERRAPVVGWDDNGRVVCHLGCFLEEALQGIAIVARSSLGASLCWRVPLLSLGRGLATTR